MSVENIQDRKEYKKLHRKNNIHKYRKYSSDSYQRNREHLILYQRRYRRKIKLLVLTHYSFGDLRCRCCGEKELDFLTIDHVNGGGREHHKLIGGGATFYLWLKRNNFPLGYQVLCYNCNCARSHVGECPHQRPVE